MTEPISDKALITMRELAQGMPWVDLEAKEARFHLPALLARLDRAEADLERHYGAVEDMCRLERPVGV